MTNPTPREIQLVEAALKAAAEALRDRAVSDEIFVSNGEEAIRSLDPAAIVASVPDHIPAGGEKERAEAAARTMFSAEIDWSDPVNLGATAAQRAYFRAGWQARAALSAQEQVEPTDAEILARWTEITSRYDALVPEAICKFARALLSASKGER